MGERDKERDGWGCSVLVWEVLLWVSYLGRGEGLQDQLFRNSCSTNQVPKPDSYNIYMYITLCICMCMCVCEYACNVYVWLGTIH